MAKTERLTGKALLKTPARNKGTAFSIKERRAYDLEGLLPSGVENISRQVERVQRHLALKQSDLERYIYLMGLLDRNETLFYRVIMNDPMHFLPILYDPTVGEACLRFSEIFRQANGMYISLEHRGRIEEILRQWPIDDVRFICVSSGGRILGLGDLGINGMGIPIGKLQLYTACAGVTPGVLLPIMLDIGTDNDELRADSLYLGRRQRPPEREELDAFVDEFMVAVQKVFPHCCVHFEDWKGVDAIHYLARYRHDYLCFNDDIQGTAAVVLAGVLSALEISGKALTEQRFLFLGAGSAGIGIANMLVSALEQAGLSQQEARQRIWLFDIDGLIENSRKDLSDAQRVFAHKAEASDDFAAVVKTLDPTALIGVSTCGGAFTREIVQSVSSRHERPIIMALSNPTEHAEVNAENAYQWSEGRALYAAGVQFPDVTLDGQTFHPGQANNLYIFPAVGLAVYATRPARITDEMFIRAARATSQQVNPDQLDAGHLYPGQESILSTSVTTATMLAEWIFDNDMAGVERPTDVRAYIESLLYNPGYDET